MDEVSSIKSYDWERPKAQPKLSDKMRGEIEYESSVTGSSEDDDGIIGHDSESSEMSSEGTESEQQSSYSSPPKGLTE